MLDTKHYSFYQLIVETPMFVSIIGLSGDVELGNNVKIGAPSQEHHQLNKTELYSVARLAV